MVHGSKQRCHKDRNRSQKVGTCGMQPIQHFGRALSLGFGCFELSLSLETSWLLQFTLQGSPKMLYGTACWTFRSPTQTWSPTPSCSITILTITDHSNCRQRRFEWWRDNVHVGYNLIGLRRYLLHWHRIQDIQDSKRNLSRGGACFFKVQVSHKWMLCSHIPSR